MRGSQQTDGDGPFFICFLVFRVHEEPPLCHFHFRQLCSQAVGVCPTLASRNSLDSVIFVVVMSVHRVFWIFRLLTQESGDFPKTPAFWMRERIDFIKINTMSRNWNRANRNHLEICCSSLNPKYMCSLYRPSGQGNTTQTSILISALSTTPRLSFDPLGWNFVFVQACRAHLPWQDLILYSGI